MAVRIGIDVGGTFTDAAAINSDTYELIGSIKIPTSHKSESGVAEGIVQALEKLMELHEIKPSEVQFIAHGTTQATNALLEGDVENVGILTIGSGLEGMKSRNDTLMGEIELAPGKYLHTENEFVSSGTSLEEFKREVRERLEELSKKNARSIVAAEAFSVDNPENENLVLNMAKEMGLPSTATNDISKLYGLKVRTRTAVINASILPKMLETANMTESSIKNAKIESPLMVMRCDGGVMSIDEVRNRPILTVLSGPAAGVAGALMYEKITDGIFFEVGGTSTDISCIKDGKVMIKYSEIGGHKTYLNSLDVRTVGIGGGSMVQVKNGKAVQIGPRSAHIAGIDYECYAAPEEIVEPVLKTIRPKETDPEYGYVECSNGKTFCLTMAGAAMIAGYIEEGDYAYGNREAAEKVWAPLAESMGITVLEAAKKVLAYAAEKNGAVVEAMLKDYNISLKTLTFIGGGGGASTVVPHLGETMGVKTRIAKNAPVISTIGVALAMVRELVERVVANPTEEEILSVRREAENAVIKSGATPESVEVHVEVDTQRNVIRAVAVGTSELRTKDLTSRKLTEEELLKKVSENLEVEPKKLRVAGSNGMMYAICHTQEEKKLFGLIKSKKNNLRLIDHEGVIRLQKNNADVKQCDVKSVFETIQYFLNEYTEYNDGGTQLPNLFVIQGKKIIDISGLQNEQQVMSIAKIELSHMEESAPLLVISTNRSDT